MRHAGAGCSEGGSACGRARRGFTLAESLLASVVLAVAVLAVFAVLSASGQQGRAANEAATAAGLAQELLERIESLPFDDPNQWEQGETAETWDDVFDYDGFGRNEQRQDGYRREVSVRRQGVPGASGGAQEAALIRVTVTAPTGEGYRVDRLVCRNSWVW